MTEPDECDLCKLEARGVQMMQTSILDRLDVTVCDRHMRMLRDQ